jgi:hypothetical protein
VYVKNMAKLDKNDLAQMNEDYFKSLEKERLVEVAKNGVAELRDEFEFLRNWDIPEFKIVN